MKTTNRIQRKAGKKGAVAQSASSPENLPGKPQSASGARDIVERMDAVAKERTAVKEALRAADESSSGAGVLAVVELLAKDGVKLSASAVSQHLLALEELGFVRRAEGGWLVNEIDPRESQVVKLGSFEECPNGYAATVRVSGDIYLALCTLATQRGQTFPEIFRRVTLEGLCLQSGELFGELNDTEDTLRELKVFSDTLSAALRTWNTTGQFSPDKMDDIEAGIMSLHRRLFAAIETHLANARAALNGGAR